MAFLIPGIRALWPNPLKRAGRDAPHGASSKPRKAAGARAKKALDKEPEGGTEEGQRPSKPPDPSAGSSRSYAREAGALLLIATGLYCALALASYQADPMRPAVHGANWVGPVGEVFARWTVSLVGVVTWLVPLELALLARPLLRDRAIRVAIKRLSGDVVIAVMLAALAHIALPEMTAFGKMPLGGQVGDLFGEVLQGLFSTIGSFLIGGTIVALILVERAAFSFIEVAQRFGRGMVSIRSRTDRGVSAVTEAWAEARDRERERRQEERKAAEPVIASPEQADAIIAAFADDGDAGSSPGFLRRAAASRRAAPRRGSGSGVDVAPAEPATADGGSEAQAAPGSADLSDDPMGEATTGANGAAVAAAAVEAPALVAAQAQAAEPGEPGEPVEPATPSPGQVLSEATTPSLPAVGEATLEVTEAPEAQPAGSQSKGKAKKSRKRKAKAPDEPTIVDTSGEAKVKKAKRRLVKGSGSAYQLPSPQLLDPVITDGWTHSPDQMKETARLLEKTLKDYGVEGKVQEIRPGPTLTTFEVAWDQGVQGGEPRR
ncbi:MAG: DNA translocase FtsK 4TM domain-containing protein [Deltaproteobacteria bacterium]|nr:DNA translocase FtsK 4TM domain-containing protein [Deltaproteobacteria bacterium]